MPAVDALETLTLEKGRKDAPTQHSNELSWRVLILLNVFRMALAVVLLAVFAFIAEPHLIGDANPKLAWTALAAMLGVGMLEVPLLQRRLLSARAHTYLQFTLDLAIITALTHASGGVSSGVGGLLVVTVGTLSLLVPTERAFLLAAVSALAILLEQTLAQLQGMAPSAQYAPAGILGAVIFGITAVVQLLRRRIVETEALAEQRGVDLKDLGELNRYIIQHLRESIVVVDGDDRVRLMNESAAKHLGADSRSAGRGLADVSSHLATVLQRWRRRREAPSGMQSSFGSADGSTTILPHFAPLGDESSGGVLIFLEDTSLLAERVQQTKLAALGRLSASIAHEIRNPVGAMSHAGQLLAESPKISADEQRLTDIIRVNARRVSQIVDSVLTLSKRDRTRPERLGLKAWMEDFAREFTATLELHEGSVTVVGAPPELEVRIDPTQLHQIVWNLCDNAVKYASEAAGAISVELSCGRLEGSGRPFLEVADRGPGVAPDKVEQIFEPFYTGQHGGTGLGLFISRELCESNGAALRYHPRPGGGSVFRIVFADPQRWRTSEQVP